MPIYTVTEDSTGRSIDFDGEQPPDQGTVDQAFRNFDAFKIAQAGPRGSRERRVASAQVNAQNSQDAFAQESGGATAGKLTSGLASLPSSLSQAGTDLMKGVALVSQLPNPFSQVNPMTMGTEAARNQRITDAGGPVATYQDTPLYKAADSLEQQAKVFYPVNPKETLANLPGSAIGSGLSVVAAGPAAIPAYALQSAQQGVQESLDNGADPNQALAQGVVQGITGAATEASLGLVPFLKEAAKGVTRGFVKPTAKAILGEAIQEPTEGILNRLSAKYVTQTQPGIDPFDPKTIAMEVAGGAIGAGAISGGFTGASQYQRGQRLAAIQKYRSDPLAQLANQVENGPMGSSPQYQLEQQLRQMPRAEAPRGILNLQPNFPIAGLSQDETGTGAGQIIDPAGQTPFDTFQQKAVRTQRRANVEQGLTMDQSLPDTSPEIPSQATPLPPTVVGFKTAMGSTYVVDGQSTTRNKAARSSPGHEGDSGAKTPSDMTVYVDKDRVGELSSAGLSGLGSKGSRVVIHNGKATLLFWSDANQRWQATKSGRDIPVTDTPAVGLAPLELWKPSNDFSDAQSWKSMHAGNPIVSMDFSQPVDQPATPVEQQAGQYPAEGFGTGTIVTPEEQARRDAVRERVQQANAQQANAQQAEQARAEALRQQNLQAQALVVAARQAEAERQAEVLARYDRMKARPISTPFLDALLEQGKAVPVEQAPVQPVQAPLVQTDQGLTEVVQPEGQTPVDDLMVRLRAVRRQTPSNENQVAQTGSLPDVQGQPTQTRTEVQAAPGTPQQESASPQVTTPSGVRLRKQPISRSNPAAAQRLATLGQAAPSSEGAASSAFGVRSYGGTTITQEQVASHNQEVERRAAEGDATAIRIQKLIETVDTNQGVGRFKGYESLPDSGRNKALAYYSTSLYRQIGKWLAGEEFKFQPLAVSRSATSSSGKTQAVQMEAKTVGETPLGEDTAETNLTQASQPIVQQVPLAKPVKLQEESVKTILDLQRELGVSSESLVRIIHAFQDQDTSDLDDQEMSALQAATPTLNKLKNVHYSVAGESAQFYSRLIRTVELSQQGKATGAQWKALIKNSKLGTNSDEFTLVGVNDLEDGKTYTKAEVLEYLNANQVVVKDVTRGGPTRVSLTAEMDQADEVFFGKVRALGQVEVRGQKLFDDEIGWGLTDGTINPSDLPPNLQADAKRWLKAYQERQAFKDPTKTYFDTYQLPGGKEGSYREVLLTVPNSKGESRMNDLKGIAVQRDLTPDEVTEYKSLMDTPGWRDGHSQYDFVTNPVVRLRFNERTSADGKKMLFLEEVQAPQNGQFEKMPSLFQKNWREIAFKWAIRHAAENGFDSVGWTTGEQQAERYDLSKQVDSIGYRKNPDGSYDVSYLKDGRDFSLLKDAASEELEGAVGKGVAKTILENGGQPEQNSPGWRSISGEGLKVGGEGLKKLYDSDFRNVVNGLAAVKKSGQKVGMAEVFNTPAESPGIVFQSEQDSAGRWIVVDSNGYMVGATEFRAAPAYQSKSEADAAARAMTGMATIHSLTITPAIRDSVMGGQALFSLSTLIREPLGLERTQQAVDQWRAVYGGQDIAIRVVDDPNLKTPDGRTVAAQIELVPGGQPIITINASQVGSVADVHEKIWHELFHTVWGDESVQQAWGEVMQNVDQRMVEGQLARGYSPAEAAMEAAIDLAAMKARDGKIRSAWKRFLDKVWNALKKTFGFEVRPNNFEELMISALRQASRPWNRQSQNSYNQDVAANDKAYLEAVTRGDMATAQKMVDEAAKAAGYNVGPVYHGTNQRFTVFDLDEAPDGFHFGTKETADQFGQSKPFFLKGNVKRVKDMGRSWEMDLPGLDEVYEYVNKYENSGTISYVVSDPEQIKSSKPVTYDDAGNVVLLSQRFNPQTGDIRYSVANNLYVTSPARFKTIANEGQTEAVAAQGQVSSAIVPESTLKVVSDLEAKQDRTPVENATLKALKGVSNIAQVAQAADQLRANVDGMPSYTTINQLPEEFKSVGAQSVMATHFYLNQFRKSIRTQMERTAGNVASLSQELADLTPDRLLATLTSHEADEMLVNLQRFLDVEHGKLGTSNASRTREELDRASAAIVGMRRKIEAISAGLQAVAKEMPLADFDSPADVKAWLESRMANKALPKLMGEDVFQTIRVALNGDSTLHNRLSMVRGLMADTQAAKKELEGLAKQLGSGKPAVVLKRIIEMKGDARAVLDNVRRLDTRLNHAMEKLEGLTEAGNVMDQMQVDPTYQERVKSAFDYAGFKYSGVIRFDDQPSGNQTLLAPDGTEYRINFSPDFAVEQQNFDTLGKWMEKTLDALTNPDSPQYITDPAKRTSYANTMAFVSRFMMDKRGLVDSAWSDAGSVQTLNTILGAPEKLVQLKFLLGDHLNTRFNLYRNLAGRAGLDLVQRSRAIDRFMAEAKNIIDATRTQNAVARRKAILSHNLNPDDPADYEKWNTQVNSWILSQNQNPGSQHVREGIEVGEGLTVTKEDIAFAGLQHKFSRAISEAYSGIIGQDMVQDPDAPGYNPEENLFGQVFSRKAMQYGFATGRKFSHAGRAYTKLWMEARGKDLAQHKALVAAAPEGTEVPMVYTERKKVAEESMEGHVYSHIRESNPEYRTTANKALKDAYRGVADAIRNGNHYSSITDLSMDLAELMSTDEKDVSAFEAEQSLMNALDRDVVNYNKTAEVVGATSKDETVTDLPPAIQSIKSAKGALVKARGKMVAPSFFYDYSLGTDLDRSSMVQMGKQALMISELNAARNMVAAMRDKLDGYERQIDKDAKAIGRNGKPIGRGKAISNLDADLKKKFKEGAEFITYKMLKKHIAALETSIGDREKSMVRERVTEEESFKVSMVNALGGGVISSLLSAPAPMINNMLAVVIDPVRVGMMVGGPLTAINWFGRGAMGALKYSFQKLVNGVVDATGVILSRDAKAKLAEMASFITGSMLDTRSNMERSGVIDAPESFSSIWSRYKNNPATFGRTTSGRETEFSKAFSRVMTSPLFAYGLIPAMGEFLKQKAPGAGDRMVNYVNAEMATLLSNRVAPHLWNWVNEQDGATVEEKIRNAMEAGPITAEDLGVSLENASNIRDILGPAGSLEKMALDYYRANPDGAKGPLLSQSQREAVEFEIAALTNKETDSTRPEITKGGAGMENTFRRMLYLFARYILQHMGVNKRVFGMKGGDGGGLSKDLKKGLVYLFVLAMTLLAGSLALPIKQLARTLLQREPLTSPTIVQAFDSPEMAGKYLASAAMGVLPVGAAAVGMALTGNGVNGPITANFFDSNPIAGAANNLIQGVAQAYQTKDLTYPALDLARKTFWFSQPVINSLMPGDTMAREASRAVRTAATGLETRPQGGAMGRSTPVTPLVRDAVAAIYEGNTAAFNTAKQKAIDYYVAQGKTPKEAEARFTSSVSGRDPFKSVFGRTPTADETALVNRRVTSGQADTLSRANFGRPARLRKTNGSVSLRKRRKSKGYTGLRKPSSRRVRLRRVTGS